MDWKLGDGDKYDQDKVFEILKELRIVICKELDKKQNELSVAKIIWSEYFYLHINMHVSWVLMCLFACVVKQSLKYSMNNVLCFYFVAYYFALNIVALNETMKNGSLSFGLLKDLGVLEYPRLYV